MAPVLWLECPCLAASVAAHAALLASAPPWPTGQAPHVALSACWHSVSFFWPVHCFPVISPKYLWLFPWALSNCLHFWSHWASWAQWLAQRAALRRIGRWAAAELSNRSSHWGPTPCSPEQSAAAEISPMVQMLLLVVVLLLVLVLVLTLAVLTPVASFAAVVVWCFHTLLAAWATDWPDWATAPAWNATTSQLWL